MSRPYFRFCPRCATPLRWRTEHAGEPRRQRCPRCGFTFYSNPIGATDAVFLRGRSVLLVRRNREPARGRYDFPGGFLDGFEHPEHGAIRETREEVGLRFTPRRLIGVYVNTEYRWQGRRVPAVVLSYLGTATGRLRLSSEVAQPEWVPITKRVRMAFKYQAQTLRDLRRLLRR